MYVGLLPLPSAPEGPKLYYSAVLNKLNPPLKIRTPVTNSCSYKIPKHDRCVPW